MFNIVSRLIDPYALYRRYINSELEPFVEMEGVAVAGLKTARRARFELNWAHGTISQGQLRRLARTFSTASADAVRIVVAHHPLLEPSTEVAVKMQPVRRAEAALKAFHSLGVRAVLSGHFHLSYVRRYGDDAVEGAPVGPMHAAVVPLLVVQASSAISTRLRGEPNAYNLIDVGDGHISATVREYIDDRWVTRGEVSAHS